MNQSKIVKLLRKEFGHHEVTVFTASAKNKAGILDTEIAYRGQSWWLEIKVLPDKLSKMQEKFIQRHLWSAFVLTYDPDNGLLYFGNLLKRFIEIEKCEFYKIKHFFDKII